MERGRIAEVHAGEYGTGYLVAPGLLLTAAHVIANPTAIVVRFLTDGAKLPGTLVWRSDSVDAALIRLDRDLPPVRWGRLVSSAGGVSAEVGGFPAAQKLPDRRRGTDRLLGTLDPLAGAPHHAEFLLTEDAPVSKQPWNGLSGAAILCQGLVTAIAVQSLDTYEHRRLPAIPVERCFADLAFRGLLDNPALEPVELLPVLGQRTPVIRSGSPASLLRADAEVVPFLGRTTELDDLTRWCEGGGFAVRLLTGPGGRGKSRLVRELVHRMEKLGWATGQVADHADIESVREHLTRLDAPVLLVVDYAETRPDQVRELVSGMSKSRGRIVLIARTKGDWWEQLAVESPRELRDVFRAAPAQDVPPFLVADRRELFDEVVRALTPRVPDAPEVVQISDLSAERYGSPLLIGMLALARLLSREEPTDLASAADIILDHEQPYWASVAARYGLTIHHRDQRKAVAAFSLCGAADEAEALALLAKVPGFTDQSDEGHGRRQRAASWLKDLHPPTVDGTAFCGSLQPDLLAEHLIAEIVGQAPGFLGNVLTDASEDQVQSAFTVLSRAAGHTDDLVGAITTVLRCQPRLAVHAIKIVPQADNYAPLVAALEDLLAAEDAGSRQIELLIRLSGVLPHRTQRLSGVAVTITTNLVKALRLANALDEGVRSDMLAEALSRLSNRLGDVGRDAEALETAAEAVEIFRRTPAPDAEGWRSDLATMLSNLSNRLDVAGRHVEGLAAIQEAVQIRRELVATGSEQPHNLAMGLHNMSHRLADLGRHEEALSTVEEAVEMCRGLAKQDPARLAELAFALASLSIQLAELGRHEEALSTVQEATAIWDQLAQRDPDAWTPYLATVLHNQALQLARLEQWDAALAAGREAKRIFEDLAAQIPARFEPDLAKCLWMHGRLHIRRGEPLAAVEMLAQAVHLAEAHQTAAIRKGVIRVLVDAYRSAPEAVEAEWERITGEPLPPEVTGAD